MMSKVSDFLISKFSDFQILKLLNPKKYLKNYRFEISKKNNKCVL